MPTETTTPLREAEQLLALITDAQLDGNLRPQAPEQAARLARAKTLALAAVQAARPSTQAAAGIRPYRPGTWLIRWDTELDPGEATTAEEAAVRARLQQRPGTSAVVFIVTAPDGTRTEVDLGTHIDQTEPPALAAAAVARWAEDQPEDNPRAQVRAALARMRAPYDPDDLGDDTDNPEADFLFERADHLAAAAERLLAWMEANDVDPGDPPLCGCGGYHWTCSADDAHDDEPEPETCRQCCTETEGLEDVQGTLLCQACIAYNVSRCM